MNHTARRFTFQPMRLGRVVRLLLLALPIALGVAAGAERPEPTLFESASTISAPRQSLPPPVHDEATCAFCQAAVFPPCAPQPTNVAVASLGLVRRECVTVEAVTPRFTTHRPTSSRAPPTLRAV